LTTHAVHEYLFLLDNPKTTGTAVSEITALTDTTFLVDERDGLFPASGGYKKLWKIDLAGATDVGPNSPLIGQTVAGGVVTYSVTSGGLLVGGNTIEKTVSSPGDTNGGTATANTLVALLANDIMPVSAAPFLDVDGLLGTLDPGLFRFFSHDKVE